MSADDIVTLLDELIHTAQDGRKGYAEAAEFARDAELKKTFLLRSSECAQAIGELQLLVQQLGREPAEQGSIAGTAHRGWIRLRSAMRDSNRSVLEEVERGEDHARSVYARVLRFRLPPEVEPTVQAQYRTVLRNHNEARNLRDRYAA